MRAGYDVRAVKRWRAGLACWASAASATPAASSSIGTGTLSSVDSVSPTAPMRLSTLYSFMRPNTTSQAGDSAQRPARRQGQCVQAQTRGEPRLPSLLHCTRIWLLCTPELQCLALCARWHRPVAPAQAPCGLAWASSRRPARPHCASTDVGQAQAPIPAALHTHMAAVRSRTALPCTMHQMAQAGGSCPGSLWSRRGVVSSAGETTLCATHLAMRARAPIPHPAASAHPPGAI